MISIFNSLTKQKEPFVPLRTGEVRVYVCGVTVYDDCHIGHARSAFVFDMVRRVFRAHGFKTRFVRNVTDVDDKIIERAREELTHSGDPLNAQTIKAKMTEVAERYRAAFLRDMKALQIEGADLEPRATGHILEMIQMIQVLLDQGAAYARGGDVFFEVKKFRDYGKLSKQSPDQMISGARVDVDDRKKNPLDFALWKAAKGGEPAWEAPWGAGRPGWHIECSAMATRYLGPHFDIHCGGRDLIFPHHENEIAQSECATGAGFANVWMHNGLLTIHGEKMAKSLGNFISIEKVLSEYPAEVLKFFFLSAQYASPIDYTQEKMDQAAQARERFYIYFNRLDKLETIVIAQESGRPSSNILELLDEADQLQGRFEEALEDDFNTPAGLAILFELLSLGNKILEEDAALSEQKILVLKYIGRVIQELGQTVGLFIERGDLGREFSQGPLVKLLLDLREHARKKKDFESSDRVRSELEKLGIVLEDTPQGTSYRVR